MRPDLEIGYVISFESVHIQMKESILTVLHPYRTQYNVFTLRVINQHAICITALGSKNGIKFERICGKQHFATHRKHLRFAARPNKPDKKGKEKRCIPEPDHPEKRVKIVIPSHAATKYNE